MHTRNPLHHRQDLTPLLEAKSVAIVGISQPDRFGGILYKNLEGFGYGGRIYGINPRYESLYDQPCYGSLRDLPERPDCALLAVPNARLVDALQDAAECAIPAAVIFASAYSEPAEGEPSLAQRLREIALAHDMIVCGPNCMGFVSLASRLPITGYPTNPGTPAGNVTLISHSGSVWDAFLQNRRDMAFNYIVSPGSEMVTSMADYMQFSLNDPTTRAIGLFLETVRDPATFTAALTEAAERDIPVVALKTGRSERGAQLARAHSGALAGADGAYNALFAHYGVRRVRSIDEMIDTLELFATGMRPATPYVSALLDSGGQRALLVDLAEAEGVAFAPITEATSAKLAEVLEPGLDPINPLDAWGTGNGSANIYVESLQALDADPSTGLNLFAVDLYPLDDPGSYYPSIVRPVKDALRNPLAFMVHLSLTASEAQMAQLREMGVPVLMGTETGLRATRHVLEYSAFQRARAQGKREATREVPQPGNLDALRAQLANAVGALDEYASKQFLQAYGLDVTRELRADSLDETLRAAREIGYPVALKTASGDLHKTEREGVRLDIETPETLAAAYRDFEARLGAQVLVQEMIPPGVELILGVVNDAQFGAMLTVGLGGILVEVLKDVRMLMLPTTAEAVREALLSLRGAALLRGVRGRPPVDLKAVIGSALGLAALAGDLGEWIGEIDVNPLTALPDRAVAVDALILPKRSA
ncbi:MAG: acetate--CoA ligase family protein [Myxococcales bacterium]|nr:acetate--CoA ligase family protein [Myxococcales bacterium]